MLLRAAANGVLIGTDAFASRCASAAPMLHRLLDAAMIEIPHMLRNILLTVIALVFFLQPADAQREKAGDWELLGEQRVGFTVDRDVINIGQSEEWFRNRSFRALRFEVERSDVHMLSIRLVYLNGHVEELRVDRQIRAGSRLPIDLRGERSYLKQIEMTYRSSS